MEHDRATNSWRWAVVIIAISVAGVWLAVLAVVALRGPALEHLLLVNGLAVSIYGLLFAIARRDRLRILSAVAAVSLGVAHLLWMPMVTILLVDLLVSPGVPRVFGTNLRVPSMLFATGSVFSLSLGIATRDWRCFLPIALATITAVALQVTPGLPPWCAELALGCIVLHAGIAAGLAWSTVRTFKFPDSDLGVTVCLCGYNLRGLPRPICPECGRIIAGPPMNLPRLDQV
jgi:hypothetical protein